ncbi:DUF3348 domain-containing protein [Xanthomonas sp. NCPPB 2632]|jgi:hypothetical protein|uniref:DUF3348 domain-containing protein n=1 Tax=Xanthomonas sp. NCPPB 2632 TaxID=3240912 RepID=UPI0035184848
MGVFSPADTVQRVQRTSVRGPTFIRLLSRLTDVDTARPNIALPDRLSQWLDWTHALALSAALDGTAAPVADDVSRPLADEAAECARVRQALGGAIAGARELVASGDDTGGLADFAPFRQRYLVLQRSMQAQTGQLRGRLRDSVASVSADMARLAGVDAVMEAALSPREQALLGQVPGVLGRHFDRLRIAAQAEGTAAWLDTFRKDMQSVLLAELHVRFQPVDALLAALPTR